MRAVPSLSIAWLTVNLGSPQEIPSCAASNTADFEADEMNFMQTQLAMERRKDLSAGGAFLSQVPLSTTGEPLSRFDCDYVIDGECNRTAMQAAANATQTSTVADSAMNASKKDTQSATTVFDKNKTTPAAVLISIFINNIDSIDSSVNEWIGDVIVRIRYQESDFPGDKHPVLMIHNGKTDAITEKRRRVTNGIVSETSRMKVMMTFDGNFDTFPFDTQDFELHYILEGLTTEQAVFVKDTEGESGVHDFVPRMGRRFTAAQFRVQEWDLKCESKKESKNQPYFKSHATMRVTAKRYLPYYAMYCIALPLLPTLFAISAFHLPVNDLMPRVTMSFVAFITLFVHLQQTMECLPTGVWCWVMTEVTFFCFVLTIAIAANIGSAVCAQHHMPLARRHDRIQVWVLKIELLVGMILLLMYRHRHFAILQYIMVPLAVVYHGLVCIAFVPNMQRDEVGFFANFMGLSYFFGPIPAREPKKANIAA